MQLAAAARMQTSLDALANTLTPQMIALQDEYILQLTQLRATTQIWEDEQQAIAIQSALLYQAIAESSAQVAANTATLRADIQLLVATVNTLTNVVDANGKAQVSATVASAAAIAAGVAAAADAATRV